MDGFITKRAAVDDTTATARLHHEAAVLERLAHPGVVELVDLRESDDGRFMELRTVAVDGPSLSDVDPADLPRIVAALATTVADLHDFGVAHTRITPDHVLLDDAHRPVLCGLAGAVDCTPHDDAAVKDVEALVRLLPSWEGATTTTTTARAFADALWTQLEHQVEPAPGRRRPARVPLRWAAGGTGAAAAVAAVLLLGVGRPHPTTRQPQPAAASNVVDIDGRSYSVGQPGDQVVTGKFDCHRVSAAVLTTEGGLYVFDEVAQSGHDTTARHLRDADPAATLIATDDDGDGCDELTVEPDEGDEITVSARQP